MKRMSKPLALLAAVLLLASALVACTATQAPTVAPTTAPTEAPTVAPTPEPTPTPTPEPTPEPTIAPAKITFALWGDKELAKKDIEMFNKLFPQITVEIDTEMDWPWTEKLAAAAAANKLPDVFWVFEVPVEVQSNLLADLTPYLEKDKDFSADQIFGNLADTGKYNNKYYALPNAIFAQVVLINKDLLAKENIPMPSADWTLDQFIDIATKLTKPAENQYGLASSRVLMEHMMQNDNANLGWYTWNAADQSYHFTDPAFAKYVNLARDLAFNKKITLDQFSADELTKIYGKDVTPFYVGKVGMMTDFSWSLAYASDNAKFNWDVLPMPKVNGQRLGMVTDYMAMSAVSKNPEAAFQFFKYMTYAKQGWLNKMDIYNPYTGFPLIKDQDVWAKYRSQTFYKPGLDGIISLIPTAYMDGMKWLPGWSNSQNASYWKYADKLFSGEVKPEDIAPEMEKGANQAYKDALDALAKVK